MREGPEYICQRVAGWIDRRFADSLNQTPENEHQRGHWIDTDNG